MDNQTQLNAVDIAVLKTEMGEVKSDVKDIKTNHLAHIADDIKLVLKIQESHGKKFIQYDTAKNIFLWAVATIIALLGIFILKK